jgi:hypothetical protein
MPVLLGTVPADRVTAERFPPLTVSKKEYAMKRTALCLTVFAVLAVVSSAAVAYDGPSVRYAAGYGPGVARIHEVRHHGHYAYRRGYSPVIVAPVPVYQYPAYPPAVVYPPAPAVYPAPAYAIPRPYYDGYPQSYIQFRGRGLSIGFGF